MYIRYTFDPFAELPHPKFDWFGRHTSNNNCLSMRLFSNVTRVHKIAKQGFDSSNLLRYEQSRPVYSKETVMKTISLLQQESKPSLLVELGR